MPFTLGAAILMAVIGTTGTATCGGAGGWAIPANTALLILLAFIQQAHYRRTAQVERIVDQRKQDKLPPDREWKRSDDR